MHRPALPAASHSRPSRTAALIEKLAPRCCSHVLGSEAIAELMMVALRLMPCQRSDMGDAAAAERGQIVAALEHRDDALICE